MKTSKNKYWNHKTAEIQRGAIIGQGTKIWHNCQILKGAKIGKDCVIGHNCFVGHRARIGNGVKLESNIDVWDLVNLEDYVFIGPSVVFTNDKNPRAKYPKRNGYSLYGKWLPTTVSKGATLGANSTIICGNIIGEWAIIGAGAVVTSDIPNYALAIGFPAKVIGWICECGNKIQFKGGKSFCKICKRKYKKSGNKVSQI